ncbi:MAG: DsbA family protein [Candidatus Micrarchaeia archaeon]
MTDKEEPKKTQGSSGSSEGFGENKIWLVGLFGLIVGMLVMYLAMPAILPAEETPPTEVPPAEGEEGEFTPDEGKIEEIRQLLADTYLLNTGQEVTVTFTRYEEADSHVALYYDVMGQEMPLYVSKNYKYIYPSAMDVSTMEEEVAAAKEQYLANLSAQPEEPEGFPTSAEPEVYLFLMSNCPYGNLAENAIVDVVGLLEGNVSFEPVYIIYDESVHPSYSADSGECLVDENNETYCSMHGLYELEQGIREKMIYNRYGEATWAEYATAVNSECFDTGKDIETCWKTVAEAQGINTTEIEESFDSEKYTILEREKQITFSTQNFGSPSMIINGVKYSGPRSPEAYKEAICSSFTESPEECFSELSDEQEGPAGQC